GAGEIVERVLVGLGPGIGETARGIVGADVGSELDGLGVVLDAGGRVAGLAVGLAAQRIDLGVARLEGDGAAEVLHRLLVATDRHLGLGTTAVGGAEAGIERRRTGEIADGSVWAVGGEVGAAAPAQRRGAVGRELDGLAVGGNGGIDLALLHLGAGAVAVGRGIAGRQQQGAVEVPGRLLHSTQGQEHVAAVVV